MSINIPTTILGLKGQCVNTINCDFSTHTITIICRRDSRYKPIDPINNKQGTVNCYVRRIIHDLPLLACRCQIEIELVDLVIGITTSLNYNLI